MDAPTRNAAAAVTRAPADAASRIASGSSQMNRTEKRARRAPSLLEKVQSGGDGAWASLFREGYQFNFFQAVRLVEHLFPQAPAPGETTDFASESLRLCPSSALVFPAADVRRVEHVAEGEDRLMPGAHVRLTATFMGLYGVDAALPTPFTEPFDLRGEDGASSALRHFLDVFNHRLYAFFYRSWKKHRPVLHGLAQAQHRPRQQDAHARRFLALAGLGTPEGLARGLNPTSGTGADGHSSEEQGEASRGKVFTSSLTGAAKKATASPTERATAREDSPASTVPPMRMAAFAGLLSRRTRSAEGLRALLSGFFETLPVEIVENVPRWIPIQNRPRMGGEGEAARLGVNTSIGARIYDRSTTFRIELGPMDQSTFQALLPGREKARQLQALLRLYVPDRLAYEVTLQLHPEAAQRARLGEEGAQLGRSTVLGRSASQVLARTVEYE